MSYFYIGSSCFGAWAYVCSHFLEGDSTNYQGQTYLALDIPCFQQPTFGDPSISDELDIARERVQRRRKRARGPALWTYLHLGGRIAKEGSREGAIRETGSPEWLRVMEA